MRICFILINIIAHLLTAYIFLCRLLNNLTRIYNTKFHLFSRHNNWTSFVWTCHNIFLATAEVILTEKSSLSTIRNKNIYTPSFISTLLTVLPVKPNNLKIENWYLEYRKEKQIIQIKIPSLTYSWFLMLFFMRTVYICVMIINNDIGLK